MSTLDGGQRVGRYRIVRFLGAGAMGEVYLAEDPHIERQLAIKTVRLAGGRPQDIEDRKKRLLREARAAGRLLHPNIVTLFDTGEEDGVLYLAFEFVEGCDLASRLEAREPPSLREVLRTVRQVAEALDYAHRQGIVHRDIKPSNILIDPTGHVKVADFGIAKVVGQNTELTVAGSVMGSPQYLSPEQIRGDELDGRSDIFSLGVVLYELLSGRRPFDGETITTLVYQILHKDASISDLRMVPLRLEQLLHRMLAKDRNDRLATASLVGEELAAIERELPEEILAAPAAPVPESMDATRVLPSRALAVGADGAPPAPGAPSGGQPQASTGAGSVASAVPAPAIPPAAPATAPPPVGQVAAPGAIPAPGGALPAPGGAFPVPGGAIPAPGAGAMPAPVGAIPAQGGAVAAPSGAVTAPSGAVGVPGGAVTATSPVAPSAPPRSSNSKVWLALAAIILLFFGALAVGAYWVVQRYLQRAGSQIGQLAPPASSAAPAATAAHPDQAAVPATPSGQSSAANGTAARPAPATGVPPAVGSVPGGGAAPASPPEAAPAAGSSQPGTVLIQPSAASRANRTPAQTTVAPSRDRTAIDRAGAAAAGGRAASTTGGISPSSSASTPSSSSSVSPSSSASSKRGASGTAARAEPAGEGDRRGGAAAGSAGGSRVEPAAPGGGQPAPAAEEREVAAAPASSVPNADSVDRVIHSGLELAFRVNPPDAYVLLDGTVIGRAEEWNGQKGGRAFTLPGTGSHLVKIKKQGMKDYRITVEAAATRGTTPVVVSLQPLPSAQVDTSDLQTIRVREAIALHVQPDVNALVLVDGATVGPVKKFAGRFGHGDEWLGLPLGMHRLTLIAPGYGRRDLAVEVSPGAEKARQKIDVTLTLAGATGTP